MARSVLNTGIFIGLVTFIMLSVTFAQSWEYRELIKSRKAQILKLENIQLVAVSNIGGDPCAGSKHGRLRSTGQRGTVKRTIYCYRGEQIAIDFFDAGDEMIRRDLYQTGKVLVRLFYVDKRIVNVIYFDADGKRIKTERSPVLPPLIFRMLPY
jgi:hypothetical protein